jgi:hypothetical protein
MLFQVIARPFDSFESFLSGFRLWEIGFELLRERAYESIRSFVSLVLRGRMHSCHRFATLKVFGVTVGRQSLAIRDISESCPSTVGLL